MRNAVIALFQKSDQGNDASPSKTAVPARPTALLPPLVVELDHTLLRADIFAESLVGALLKKPLSLLRALPSLLLGRVEFEARIAALDVVDLAHAPLRRSLLDWLKSQCVAGRKLHLLTSTDGHAARQLADRLGLFASVITGKSFHDGKAAHNAAMLRQRFPDGFAYAGSSQDDLPIWRAASSAVLVGASAKVVESVRNSGAEIEAEFANESVGIRKWAKLLRIHQWSKNLLLFVPPLLSAQFYELGPLLACAAGFLLLCLVASGTYLLNDLWDLDDDRAHRSKRFRPLAAGDIPVHIGLVLALLLIAVGAAGALALSFEFSVVLAAYFAATLLYSIALKRIAILDVMVLAMLYTSRLSMGAALIAVPLSEWLMSFSMTLFFSLSMAKRYVEVARADNKNLVRSRGYEAGDANLILALGVAAGTSSLVILICYLVLAAFPSDMYAEPAWLWLWPPIVAGWVMRIWLLAHRQELHDDPVAFAVRDKTSWLLACGMAAAFALAV